MKSQNVAISLLIFLALAVSPTSCRCSGLGGSDLEKALTGRLDSLGFHHDYFVFQAGDEGVVFRIFGETSMLDSFHVIPEDGQYCLTSYRLRPKKDGSEPQIEDRRAGCKRSINELLDELEKELTFINNSRERLGPLDQEKIADAPTPQAVWLHFQEYLQAAKFRLAHALLTGPAADHYERRDDLDRARKQIKRRNDLAQTVQQITPFSGPMTYHKDEIFSLYVGTDKKLHRHEGKDFEAGYLTDPSVSKAEFNRRRHFHIGVLRKERTWRIFYLPWSLKQSL